MSYAICCVCVCVCVSKTFQSWISDNRYCMETLIVFDIYVQTSFALSTNTPFHFRGHAVLSSLGVSASETAGRKPLSWQTTSKAGSAPAYLIGKHTLPVPPGAGPLKYCTNTIVWHDLHPKLPRWSDDLLAVVKDYLSNWSMCAASRRQDVWGLYDKLPRLIQDFSRLWVPDSVRYRFCLPQGKAGKIGKDTPNTPERKQGQTLNLLVPMHSGWKSKVQNPSCANGKTLTQPDQLEEGTPFWKTAQRHRI